MSLVPYGQDGGVVEWLFDLATTILYQAYYIREWLNIAPIIVKARLRQLGRNGIDQIPFISNEMKWEIKQWLRAYFGL